MTILILVNTGHVDKCLLSFNCQFLRMDCCHSIICGKGHCMVLHSENTYVSFVHFACFIFGFVC